MAQRRGIFGIVWRAAVFGVFALVLAFAGLLALWSVAPPVSMLMIGRTLSGQGYERDYVGSMPLLRSSSRPS